MTAKKKKKALLSTFYAWILAGIFLLTTLTLGIYYYNLKKKNNKEKLIYGKQTYSYLDEYEVHGIDISKHNGELDWNMISKHTINDWGLSFVFIRASVAMADGHLEEDKLYRDNWKMARENGFIRGAYHFYSPTVPIEKQISLFSKLVKLRVGDLPPVLDVENYDRGNIYIQKKHLKEIKLWLDKAENKYGVPPIIYTSRKLYQDFFMNNAKFSKYKFWIANYATHLNQLEKKQWHFWQHSEEGKIDGHICDFDLNVFGGSEKDLEKICIH